MAQWCFLLARTSRGEKKQQGLTIFLVPMDAPGIEVRHIATMLGPHHLNAVFLADVWVTEADVLGEVDQGWKIGRASCRDRVCRYVSYTVVAVSLEKNKHV